MPACLSVCLSVCLFVCLSVLRKLTGGGVTTMVAAVCSSRGVIYIYIYMYADSEGSSNPTVLPLLLFLCILFSVWKAHVKNQVIPGTLTDTMYVHPVFFISVVCDELESKWKAPSNNG